MLKNNLQSRMSFFVFKIYNCTNSHNCYGNHYQEKTYFSTHNNLLRCSSDSDTFFSIFHIRKIAITRNIISTVNFIIFFPLLFKKFINQHIIHLFKTNYCSELKKQQQYNQNRNESNFFNGNDYIRKRHILLYNKNNYANLFFIRRG